MHLFVQRARVALGERGGVLSASYGAKRADRIERGELARPCSCVSGNRGMSRTGTILVGAACVVQLG